MQKTQSFVDSIIQESKNSAGTWSYAFIKEVHTHAKQMRANEYNMFIEQLMKYATDQTTEELARFKVVQLISSVKAQCYNKGEEVFISNKDIWIKFGSTIDETVLGHATNRLIKGFYFTKEPLFNQPRFISASTPIVRSTEKDLFV